MYTYSVLYLHALLPCGANVANNKKGMSCHIILLLEPKFGDT
jgi:hypothetical protein